MQNLPVQFCRWNPEDTNSIPTSIRRSSFHCKFVADAELFSSLGYSAGPLAFGLQAQSKGRVKLVGVKGWFDDDADDDDDDDDADDAEDEADDNEEVGG